jgi:ArsR family transcriptional regulator
MVTGRPRIRKNAAHTRAPSARTHRAPVPITKLHPAAEPDAREEIPPAAIKLSPTTLRHLTDIFKMLSDRNRLKIVLALARDGRLHVKALVALLKQSQPAVSHHLTLMRAVGLVSYDRIGKNNYYFLASDHIRDLLEKLFTDEGDGTQTLQFEDFALAFQRT